MKIMFINLLIGFFVGSLFTMLVIGYATGLSYENEIKKDVLVQELIGVSTLNVYYIEQERRWK